MTTRTPDPEDHLVKPDPRYGGFWENLSLDELTRRQGVKPVQNLDDLRGDWPDDEDVDAFLAWLREIRGDERA